MIFYGLKNCDTCRKALKMLVESGAHPRVVDVRADGVPETVLKICLSAFGDQLVNRRSTTWRGLSDAERLEAPLALLGRYPTLMKRPLIEVEGALYLGWSDATRRALL